MHTCSQEGKVRVLLLLDLAPRRGELHAGEYGQQAEYRVRERAEHDLRGGAEHERDQHLEDAEVDHTCAGPRSKPSSFQWKT